jgi:hypothetical protein
MTQVVCGINRVGQRLAFERAFVTAKSSVSQVMCLNALRSVRESHEEHGT